MCTIIPTGFDNVTILRGSKYKGVWEWDNCDFAGLTGTVKIKNIHPQFSDVKNTYEVGTVTIEPLDTDSNPYKGRILVELSKEDTILFAIPDDEEFSYDEQSGYYSVMNVTLSDGTVILSANVKVINSLESETLNYLLDEKDEAIIINQKLDEILARKNEYISIRDNLIDVVIPNSLETYNLNHNEKMSIYNTNHNDKLSTYNSNDTIKTNDYNQNHTTKFQEVNQVALTVQADKELIEQAKLNVLAMKDNIEGNTNSVILMKNAIEAMLDNFDDRFLGQKDSDPLLDNDGNPLVIGTIYYNNPVKELRFFNGASWDSPVASAQTYALQASQYASNALASKNASKISEDNAKLSEQNTQALANQVANNYEPKNANIQSHISNSSNPHGTTASQVGAYSISESDTKFSSKINITDIVDNLTSTLTNKPLSANQGKVLKDYIDHINTILTSSDTSLDELQEIVTFIKANKATLDALGISNIFGLQVALDAKANLTDVYLKTVLDLKISTQQFDKPASGPLLIKVSPSSIKIPAGFKYTSGANSYKLVTDYTLTLASNLVGSTKTAGTDYFVYAKSDGTFYISASDAITTDRLIGGFHYGLVGETETVTGNKLEADMVKIRGINSYSFWDLKYRPVASPKGMVNIGGKWYDIYLLNSEHITNGTSKAGLSIAGGDSVNAGRLMPKIPLEFGGNNSVNYGKFTWFQACEIAKANSKRLISYSEFPTIAYGVLEGVSSSANAYETVAGKIEHYPNLTSKYGIEQAAGVQWIWGSDLANYPTDTTWAWKANTDSRGQIYSTDNSPTAVVLGGYRGDGAVAGSRASNWGSYVWYSYWHVGCRFACDHLELV